MFTGIVGAVGTLIAAKGGGKLKRLRIASRYPARSIAIGGSIAVNGVCLTVVAKGRDWFEVETAAETLARTTAGEWKVGRKLNLERPLKAGDELGGHVVLGHVDGIARVIARAKLKDMLDLTLRAPAKLARFIAAKGSVALDGISLTVNEVRGPDFSVLLIPHTLAVTAWGDIAIGAKVNVEVDVLARYLARLAEAD
jgi:riboflavin synthase